LFVMLETQVESKHNDCKIRRELLTLNKKSNQ